MSSCAASCSTCCRRASSASATSDSLPTATALLCCRCACGCSADHSKTRLHRHHRLQSRLIHSGTVQSAVEPCASSNGSPPRNSCFALHLNQTGAPHEALSTPSAFARASARTQTLVSTNKTFSPASLSSRRIERRPTIAPLHPAFKPSNPAQLSLCLIPLHPLRPIQST
jgi:hypothetical protein